MVFDLVLGVVAMGLVTTTIILVYQSWSLSISQARLQTSADYVGVRTAPRVTETPGINAWVASVLQVNSNPDRVENLEFSQVLSQANQEEMPRFLESLVRQLHAENEFFEDPQTETQIHSTNRTLQFRNTSVFQRGENWVVATLQSSPVTRPKAPQNCASWLLDLGRPLLSKTDLVEAPATVSPARVARFYLLDEFGNFYSFPFARDQTSNHALVRSESLELEKNRTSPSFASDEFFFRFNFADPIQQQAWYSGVYLDQGGLGLVGTVAVPRVVNQIRCIVAADVSFDLDWNSLAKESIDLTASEIVEVTIDEQNRWLPWGRFLQAMKGTESELYQSVQTLAHRDERKQANVERKTVYHETMDNGSDVVAIQIDRSRWLLFLVSRGSLPLPWMTILLTGFTLAFLFVRIESGRRGALQLRKAAADQLQEKQSLLNTMQVPLMVVDPNSDEMIFCNRAAQSIGMQEGLNFGRDIVMDSPTAKARYQKMQTLSDESRRAYGVPIRVKEPNGEESERFAIIRSVAVSAPIESLKANERHRLGVLFILNEEFDVSYLLDRHAQWVKGHERKLLSGLLNHGLESLTRLLAERVSASQPAGDPHGEFLTWLAQYMSQRVSVVSWVLENWGQAPRSLDQKIISRSLVEETVRRFDQTFSLVRQDRALRQQLHWSNGVLSSPGHSESVLDLDIDWPDRVVFQIPKEGLFGFFLSEALINAIKHGKPDSRVGLSINADPVRAEIHFQVTNQVDSSVESPQDADKPYGGLAILAEIAARSGWNYAGLDFENGTCTCSWKIDSIKISAASQTD